MSQVRQAVDGDVEELVRLRVLLFDALEGDFFGRSSDGGWREELVAALTEQLAAPRPRAVPASLS
jgi:hypothetical protein